MVEDDSAGRVVEERALEARRKKDTMKRRRGAAGREGSKGDKRCRVKARRGRLRIYGTTRTFINVLGNHVIYHVE